MILQTWENAIKRSNPRPYKIGVKKEVFDTYEKYLDRRIRPVFPDSIYSWRVDNWISPIETYSTEIYFAMFGVEVLPMDNLDDVTCYLIDENDQIYGIYISDHIDPYLVYDCVYKFGSYCRELLYKHEMKTWEGIDINRGYVNFSY